MKHFSAGAGALRALSLLLSCALAMPAQAGPGAPGPERSGANSELGAIQVAIDNSGAGWSAKLSPVAALPTEQKRRLAGVPAGQRGHQPPYINPKFRTVDRSVLPARFDWRDVGGRNYLTAVKNQSTCGSCWAFAATAALESKALIAAGSPGRDLDLSEQVVLSCSNAGSCDGGWPDLAAKFLVTSGSPGETYFPYSASNQACGDARKGWQSASHRIANWQYVALNARPDVDTLKAALQANGPLVTTLRVFNDFYYYGSGIYRHVSGDYLGNHAVLLVGWNDADQAFIVKNSWDRSWGEDGYFRIAYAELNGDTEFARQMTLAEGNAIAPSTRCEYGFTPASARIAAAGGRGTIRIDTAAGCGWSVKSPASWLQLVTPGDGSGAGSIGYRVSANPEPQPRALTLDIGGQTWTLTQDGAELTPPPTPSQLLAPRGDRVPALTGFSWNPVPTAEYYYLFVRTTGGQTVVQRNVAAESLGCANGQAPCALPPLPLQPGQSYLWYVSASNARGYSGWSAPEAITTAAQR